MVTENTVTSAYPRVGAGRYDVGGTTERCVVSSFEGFWQDEDRRVGWQAHATGFEAPEFAWRVAGVQVGGWKGQAATAEANLAHTIEVDVDVPTGPGRSTRERQRITVRATTAWNGLSLDLAPPRSYVMRDGQGRVRIPVEVFVREPGDAVHRASARGLVEVETRRLVFGVDLQQARAACQNAMTGMFRRLYEIEPEIFEGTVRVSEVVRGPDWGWPRWRGSGNGSTRCRSCGLRRRSSLSGSRCCNSRSWVASGWIRASPGRGIPAAARTGRLPGHEGAAAARAPHRAGWGAAGSRPRPNHRVRPGASSAMLASHTGADRMEGSMDFHSLYAHGFVRVAAATLPITMVQPDVNAAAVAAQARELAADGVALAVFPELCLTGYSIEDLLLQDAVLDAADAAIGTLADATTDLHTVIVVGAPLRSLHRIYNCAVVLHRGEVLGVVPKSYLPTYREFYERRQIAPVTT